MLENKTTGILRRFSGARAFDTLRVIGAKQLSNTIRNKLEAAFGSVYLKSYPQIVDIVLTKACNLRCTFCRDYETQGSKRLSVENFQTAARILFPTARKLSICSGGEPYLHKQLVEFLRIARHYCVPTWLLSNGTLITDETSSTIVDEQLVTWHGFSVDGISAETVEAIRNKADFDLIVSNILRLVDIRAERRSRFPRIVIRYALMRSNIEELVDAIRFWGDAGVDEIHCSYLQVCNGIDPHESLYFHPDLTSRVFSRAAGLSEQYPDLSLSLPDPISDKAQSSLEPSLCRQPWELIRIDSDGAVLPCFHSWGLITMGHFDSLDGGGFERLWNGEKYRLLRAAVNDDREDHAYFHCTHCSERMSCSDYGAHFEDEHWINAHVMAGTTREIAEKARKR